MENADNINLKMYAFENALSIMLNSIEVFNTDKVNELFELADKIYNYIDNS